MKTLFILFLAMVVMSPALAWEGQDTKLGTSVMISSRDAAEPGSEIVYYDYGKEEYRTAEVTSVFAFGGSVQIELFDVDTGANRTFEMEK